MEGNVWFSLLDLTVNEFNMIRIEFASDNTCYLMVLQNLLG